jgi:hypothetical protein
MNRRTAFRFGGYRYLMRSDKEIFLSQSLCIKTQYKMRRRFYETERKFQVKTRIDKKKGLQGIKCLVPHCRLPLTLHAFSLLRLLRLLRGRLISYSDEVLPLPAEFGLDMGNVECLED